MGAALADSEGVVRSQPFSVQGSRGAGLVGVCSGVVMQEGKWRWEWEAGEQAPEMWWNMGRKVECSCRAVEQTIRGMHEHRTSLLI